MVRAIQLCVVSPSTYASIRGRSEVRPPTVAVDLQRPHTASQTVATSFPTRGYAKQGRRSKSPSRGDRGFACHMGKVGFPVGGRCALPIGWIERTLRPSKWVIEWYTDRPSGRFFIGKKSRDPRLWISLPN
jgi:hypothetical protein